MNTPYIHKNKLVDIIVRLVRKLSQICGIASALMIFSSILITCQMIWIRFVLGGSTIWQTEAVTYLMISATMVGLPYVQLVRRHVNVNLLPIFLPPIGRKTLQFFTLLLSASVIALMFYYGYELFYLAYEGNWTSDTVWRVTLWRPYLTMPIGFGLYTLQLLTDMIENLSIPANVGHAKKEMHPHAHAERITTSQDATASGKTT